MNEGTSDYPDSTTFPKTGGVHTAKGAQNLKASNDGKLIMNLSLPFPFPFLSHTRTNDTNSEG